MRRITSLVFVLSMFFVATAGCASPPAPPPPPVQVKGVVEIYRVDPAGTGVLVGYASPDPADSSVTYMLLVAGEQPPVMPGEPGVAIRWVQCEPESIGSEQLCATYGSKFPSGSRLWALHRDMEPPKDCK